MTLFMIFDHFVHIVWNFKNLKMHKNVRKYLLEFVTFDQNGQNAISADFEILAVNLPS